MDRQASNSNNNNNAELVVLERIEKNGQHKPRRRKLTEKRRMQNRLAQKNYREKQKRRLDELENLIATHTSTGSRSGVGDGAATSPPASSNSSNSGSSPGDHTTHEDATISAHHAPDPIEEEIGPVPDFVVPEGAGLLPWEPDFAAAAQLQATSATDVVPDHAFDNLLPPPLPVDDPSWSMGLMGPSASNPLDQQQHAQHHPHTVNPFSGDHIDHISFPAEENININPSNLYPAPFPLFHTPSQTSGGWSRMHENSQSGPAAPTNRSSSSNNNALQRPQSPIEQSSPMTFDAEQLRRTLNEHNLNLFEVMRMGFEAMGVQLPPPSQSRQPKPKAPSLQQQEKQRQQEQQEQEQQQPRVSHTPPVQLPQTFSYSPYRNNITLQQISSVNATITNAAMLGITVEMYLSDSESPFYNNRNNFAAIKPHLRPTSSQIARPHCSYLDCFVFPGFRDRVVAMVSMENSVIDEDELCQDIFQGMVCWGSRDGTDTRGNGVPWDWRSWEAKPWFLKKYWFLVGGEDEEMWTNSRWWWAMQRRNAN